MSGWPWDSTKEEKLMCRDFVSLALNSKRGVNEGRPYAMQSAPSCSGRPASSTHSPAEHCAR